VNTQSMALEARGFDTRSERSFYGSSPLAARDWVVVVVAAIVVVAVVGLRLAGFGTL